MGPGKGQVRDQVKTRWGTGVWDQVGGCRWGKVRGWGWSRGALGVGPGGGLGWSQVEVWGCGKVRGWGWDHVGVWEWGKTWGWEWGKVGAGDGAG